MNLSKVSDITAMDVAEYIHLGEVTSTEVTTLDTLIGVAKSFIMGYTGQDDLDAYQDLVIVVLVLVQDMWDNRTLYVDSNNLNRVVEAILGLHSVNLLPEESS